MARMTQQEREDADVVVIENKGGVIPISDDVDSEGSWDEWIKGLKDSDETGTVRAYRLPVDGEGNPTSAKGRQILLGSWSHQLYTLEQLCEKVKADFMRAGEVAHIRFQGNQSGRRGVMFNKIITLQKAQTATDLTPVPQSETANVIRALQDGQSQMMQLMERLATKPEEPKKDWLETFGKIAAILTPIATPLVTHLLTRQPPKSDLEALMGTMLKMKEFVNGDGGGGEDESMSSMIKAIAPSALQAFAALAANQARPVIPAGASPRRVMIRQPVPGHVAPVPIVTPETSAPAQTQAEFEPMLAQLKPQLDQLAQLAVQGAAPEEVAKLTLDMLPENDEFDAMLFDYLSDKSKFSRLFVLSPALGEQKDWAEKLRVAMLAEFNADNVLEAIPASA
jgi:hypothetical protein